MGRGGIAWGAEVVDGEGGGPAWTANRWRPKRAAARAVGRYSPFFIHVMVGCSIEPVATQVMVGRIPIAAGHVRLRLARGRGELGAGKRWNALRLRLGALRNAECGMRIAD